MGGPEHVARLGETYLSYQKHIKHMFFEVLCRNGSWGRILAPFGLHFGGISEALGSALGPWGPLGEVLEVSETGLGIDVFSSIILGGSRIPRSPEAEGDRWVWGA